MASYQNKKFNFNPEKLGKIEVDWWKAHNNKNRELLLKLLISQHVELYGLNKGDSYKALKSLVEAVRFHDIRDWNRAIDCIKVYYKMIKAKTGLKFNSEKAAIYEIGWWKIHDELEHKSDKTKLANAFTNLYTIIYNLKPNQLKDAGFFKAEATREHDLAENPNTPPELVEKHWKNTEKLLIKFYKELKKNL